MAMSQVTCVFQICWFVSKMLIHLHAGDELQAEQPLNLYICIKKWTLYPELPISYIPFTRMLTPFKNESGSFWTWITTNHVRNGKPRGKIEETYVQTDCWCACLKRTWMCIPVWKLPSQPWLISYCLCHNWDGGAKRS